MIFEIMFLIFLPVCYSMLEFFKVAANTLTPDTP
jgi:hypothetical protein